MPKVGCFWSGLFKSSNCLFPWAARETGKCSFFWHSNSYFSISASALEEITVLWWLPGRAMLPGSQPLCWASLGGFPARGPTRLSPGFVRPAMSHPC